MMVNLDELNELIDDELLADADDVEQARESDLSASDPKPPVAT